MFDAPWKLALGLITGVVFGFLLQKGRVADHAVIVRQLLLREWTVVKIMLTAIAVGAVGFQLLVASGATPLEVKPLQWGAVVVGALLFGAGMAVLGYCPGTSVAAAGEGKRDAWAGIAGMFVGAGVFVAGYPLFVRVRESLGDAGEVTWPALTSTSPWLWIAALAAATTALFLIARRRQSTARQGAARGPLLANPT